MNIWCVLVAAGRGTRSGLHENKVFFQIRGRSVLSRCLDALVSSSAFDGIVLVMNPQDVALYRDMIARDGECGLVRKIVSGGDTRRESVLNGLRALPEDTDVVAVHDAARPFVTADVILATIADARRYGSGVISTPVVDTIKRIDPETGEITTPDRKQLRAVQTPQTFEYQKLMAAHLWAEKERDR